MSEFRGTGRSVLSAREAALELGVCERTLRRYIAAGRIRHHRLPGGHIRIPVDAIDEFWAQHERPRSRALQLRSGSSSDRFGTGAAVGCGRRRRRPRLDAPVEREYDLSVEHLAEIRARYTTK
jgi:excisionase family DNA binding protein